MTLKWLTANYAKREEMIPMRDGVALYTAIYEPADDLPHPVIMERTPYPLNPYGKSFSRDLRTRLDLFVRAGYIIVFQNVRGTFMSEGRFENIRPLRPAGQGDAAGTVSGNPFRETSGNTSGETVDEATDTYDTAEWLLAHCRTNGAIGVKGISYPGFYASMAAVCGHPAIKAVSPQAPVTDWFLGDDAHLGGAFQYGMFSFGSSFFRPRPKRTNRWPRAVAQTQGDLYDFFLEKGMGVLDELRGKVDFIGEMMRHPAYDAWWQERNVARRFREVRPAVLVVGGWFDGEDCFGTFETYRRLKKQSPDTELYLAAGPWFHGAWKRKGYATLGPADFGPGSAEYFLEKIEYPFFACYLEGKGSPGPKVRILPSAETCPGNSSVHEWEEYAAWPPQSHLRCLYLGDGRKLTPEPGKEEYAYLSDPERPVPYLALTGSGWDRAAQVADQRFAARRTDVLTFSGPVLQEEMKVEGPVKVHLSLSMDTDDADFIVKLIDRRPDGVQLLLRAGVLPARFRKDFSRPEPVCPGEPFGIDMELNDIAHRFLPGHRLLVQIQSSWFPLIAMSPQKYLDNPYLARPEDRRPARITLLPGSRIDLPVME